MSAPKDGLHVTRDEDYGLSYIYLVGPIASGGVEQTVTADNDINLDFDKDGYLVGIEMLNDRALHPTLRALAKRPPSPSPPGSTPKDGEALLPCPFCGSAANLEKHVGAVFDSWQACCSSVDCVASITNGQGLKYHAILSWNNRPSGLAPLVEALRRISQRTNESGTGEMGLLNTIHEIHAIARAALAEDTASTKREIGT